MSKGQLQNTRWDFHYISQILDFTCHTIKMAHATSNKNKKSPKKFLIFKTSPKVMNHHTEVSEVSIKTNVES